MGWFKKMKKSLKKLKLNKIISSDLGKVIFGKIPIIGDAIVSEASKSREKEKKSIKVAGLKQINIGRVGK